MSFAENCHCLTPNFVTNALPGSFHRFVLLLECESRQYEGEVAVSHPRFCIGGPKATVDPRNILINDLLPLDSGGIILPTRWEKVHQFLYVVYDGTDEQGWQYRSSWPTQALAADDEQWSKKNASDAGVRRRLWMTTLVERENVSLAKMRLSEVVVSREIGLILNGPLLRLEQDENGDKKWIPRNCTLSNEKVVIMDEENGEKVDEVHVVGCQMKLLDGFAFSVRTLDGSSCVLFDTDSEETRRKWLSAIRYQIAVRSPLIDFASFPNSPTLWLDETHRIVLSGYLLKKGQRGMSWKRRYFRLTPRELQYYDEDVLKGSNKMDGATVKTDNSLEITLRFKDGTIILVKGENNKNKTVWVNAFQSQIDIFANKSLRATQPITAEDKALTIGNLGEKEEGDGAGVRKVIIPSVALKRALTSTNVNVSGPGDDNGHLASSFENYGSTNAVISVRADSNMKSPGSGGAKLMTIDGVDQNISHSNPMHPRL